MQTDRQKLGQNAEDLAALHLERRGATVLLRNYRRRLGELDLVARERDVLIIVEVRTRSSSRYGGAAASVDGCKQQRIIRAAQQLLQEYPQLARLKVRFDVAVVSFSEGEEPAIGWLPHAFQAT
jgi:putative endonuclease